MKLTTPAQWIPFAFFLTLALCACNTKDGTRFLDQEHLYTFESNSMSLTAHGATQIEDTGQAPFRCPSASGMGRDSDVVTFFAQANSLTPHFELEARFGVRSDVAESFGISLTQLPIAFLDLYEICDAVSSERYLTQCPKTHKIAQTCEKNAVNTCVQVLEGSHELKIRATLLDDKSCYTEESDRSPYSASVVDLAYACDEFQNMPILAAYRAEAQNNNCCDKNATSRLEFCVKPCGCRKLNIEFVPKTTKLAPAGNIGPDLKLAIFSNTEGHSGAYSALLYSITQHNVDMAINLGNLTESGGARQWRLAKQKLISEAWNLDAKNCASQEEDICCDSQSARKYGFLCNTLLSKLPLWVGLGDAEVDESSMNAYFKHFGASNASTIIGKTELLLLDTAEASLSSPQQKWLDSQLQSFETQTCTIPNPDTSGLAQWPLLKECIQQGKATCRECIATEAYCITPNKERSVSEYGPQNCICVPISAKYCKHNHYCSRQDGIEGSCLCSRDNDCMNGGTCNENGICTPPLRLAFTYTPLLDNFGARSTAFRSREQAAELIAFFIKHKINTVFAGKILDYAHYNAGGVSFYITGGGGAPMESFSKYPRHWLLVTIPNAWTQPKPELLQVKTIEF